jgi:hypothetical protein
MTLTMKMKINGYKNVKVGKIPIMLIYKLENLLNVKNDNKYAKLCGI